MKAFLTSILICCAIFQLSSQNIGINAINPAGNLHLRGASSTPFPNLRITDTVDAFARIKLETTLAAGNYWDIAASSSGGFSLFNLFFRNSTAQLDVLSINGETGLFSQRSMGANVGSNYYTGVNVFKGFTGFQSNHYHILAANAGGEIQFGTGGSYKNTMNAQGFLGINTLNPLAEIDISTIDPDDGAAIHMSNSNQSHFLRLYSGKLTLDNPIIYWKHGNALQLGLANADDSNYQAFLTLNGKTMEVLNTGGSIYIGEDAGEQAPLSSSRPNLAIGRGALKNSVNRNQLFAIGDSTLIFNSMNATSSTHGSDNMAVGFKALKSNTIGNSNLGIGSYSLTQNTNGSLNTAVGQYTLENSDGSFNVVFGGSAMRESESGANNVAIGYQTLYFSNGGQNTALGNTAMLFNTDGFQNTVIGNRAMHYNVTGSNNVVIGYNAGLGTTGESYSGNILIGSQAGENISANNRLYIDNSNTASPLIYGEFNTNLVRINGDLQYTGSLTDVSDVRLKKNIAEIPAVLSILLEITPVSYEMNTDKYPEKEFNPGREYGVVAQELEKHFPLIVKTDENGYKSVDYVKLSVVLLKGMQEQQQQIDEQAEQLENLIVDIKALREEIVQLKQHRNF